MVMLVQISQAEAALLEGYVKWVSLNKGLCCFIWLYPHAPLVILVRISQRSSPTERVCKASKAGIWLNKCCMIEVMFRIPPSPLPPHLLPPDYTGQNKMASPPPPPPPPDCTGQN